MLHTLEEHHIYVESTTKIVSIKWTYTQYKFLDLNLNLYIEVAKVRDWFGECCFIFYITDCF